MTPEIRDCDALGVAEFKVYKLPYLGSINGAGDGI